MRYFFVGGAPKSGTTWMQKSIDAHPEAVCSGEGHFHEMIVKPTINMFSEYNKKVNIVTKFIYEGRGYYEPLRQSEVVALIRRNLTEIMARRVEPQTRILGDKTPDYALVVRDLDAIFPGMLFVLMIRDPRDVVASRLHHLHRTSDKSALDPESGLYRKAVSGCAEEWVRIAKTCRNFATACPDRLITVHYEKLLDEPVAELTRVFGFLGVSTDIAQIEAIASQTSFEALSGRKRGVEDTSSFFRKGTKGDWENVLDAPAVETVISICRNSMEEMGYLP
jgi:hypothetical protein